MARVVKNSNFLIVALVDGWMASAKRGRVVSAAAAVVDSITRFTNDPHSRRIARPNAGDQANQPTDRPTDIRGTQ